MIEWFIVNIQSDLCWHRCLERQAFSTPRMYTFYPSKSIKGSNYGEFLKDKNALLCIRLYKYAPNLESLLTQQYVCVMCTLWSDNTCIFTRFHSVKNANTQLIWSSGNCMQVQLSKKLHASSTLNETACKFNSQRNCMQVQFPKKLHASSTLKETAYKFNSQWNCMQVQLSKKLHASSTFNETACRFDTNSTLSDSQHDQNLMYWNLL